MLHLRIPTVLLAVFVAASLGLSHVALGQTSTQWVQRHYGSVNGLPVNGANSAAIDSNGFLWLATRDGLARFDGKRFTTYDAMRVDAMSGNHVTSLYKDETGQLYALTEHGDWLRISPGQIERANLGTSEDEPQGARYVDRHSLCVTTATALHCPDGRGAFPTYAGFPKGVNAVLAVRGIDDTVWMMTRTREIWLYRNEVWHIVWRPGDREAWSLPPVGAVDRDGAFWTRFQGRALQVTLSGAQHYLSGDSDPHHFLQLRRAVDGLIWLGGLNGVFVIRKGRAQRIFVDPSLKLRGSYRSWRAPDGALWVSYKCHLWRLAPKTQNSPTQTKLANPALVCNKAINSLLFGPGQLVWVLTERDGIYRLNRPRVDLLSSANGLPGDNVYSVSRSADGSMWLGTLGSGLISVSVDGQIRQYGAAAGLPNRLTWLVASAPDGSLYMATTAPGLWRRPPSEQRFQPVPLPAALQQEFIRAITFDESGQPWIGTSVGAWRYRDGQWQQLWPTTSRRVTVYAIAITSHGLWFATNQGVWYQHGAIVHPVAARLLAQTKARNVRITSDGALWISTVGHGLVRVAADDPMGLHPLQLGRAQGLPSNSPHTIREDSKGNIWVNSNQGIFRIAPTKLQALLTGQSEKLSPLVLGRADGLSAMEGNGGVQPTAAWDESGRLWFPSQSGVVRFDPLAIHPRGEPPHPVITGVESEGRVMTLATGSSLPLGVRNVRIRYDAANLFGNGKSRFRYRLLPLAKDWTETSAERSAVYTDLSPGHYRFELLAADSDGVWTRKPTVLAFEVPAYWHETTMLRIALLVAILLVLLLLVHWRLRGLRRRANVLDRQVREHTLELKQANAALERAASHDFLTDLPNRRAFVQTMDEAIVGDEPLALAILDLDYFKAYNDSLGHVAGDRCLAKFGALLKAQGAVPGVLASRVGGEEFALLFRGAEVHTATEVLDSLVAALHELEMKHPASAAADRVSFSAGFATRRAGDRRAEDLIHRADKALYRAKEKGRNGWVHSD